MCKSSLISFLGNKGLTAQKFRPSSSCTDPQNSTRWNGAIDIRSASNFPREAFAIYLTILFQQANGQSTSARTRFRGITISIASQMLRLEFYRDKVDQELSVAQFAHAFGCHANRIKATLANGLEEPKMPGHHPAFDEDSESEILA
jgi:hypothetical protein